MKRITTISALTIALLVLSGCSGAAAPETGEASAPPPAAVDDTAGAEAEAVEPEPESEPEPEYTLAQQNAIRSAESYLGFTAFSRKGLIQQLTSEYGEGFDLADAEFAVAAIEASGGVDWNEQAAKSAQSYLELTSFSRQGLYEQLTSEYGEKFTPEQAEYALKAVGY